MKNDNMTDTAKKIKQYYDKGYYRKSHILSFYTSGILDAAEYEAVCGESVGTANDSEKGKAERDDVNHA